MKPRTESDPLPFSADRPIESRSADLLGRGLFAHALADAINGWRERDSLVIGLHGPWGSGKTSVKNMVLESLRDPLINVHSIEFNPWQWSGQDTLFEAFFREIGTAVGKMPGAESQRLRLWANKWKEYGAYLRIGLTVSSGLRHLLTLVLVLLSGSLIFPGIVGTDSYTVYYVIVGIVLLLAAGFFKFGGHFADELAEAFLRLSVSKAPTIADMKTYLRKTLEESQNRIVVFIDDIDRLPADQILSMFQLVKVNADFPGLVYVLIFDKPPVDAALQSSQTVTSDFVEKVVQVSFNIPVVERKRLDGVLFSELNKIFASVSATGEFEQDRWSIIFLEGLRPYFETMRQVRRFIASLSFHISLLSRTGTLEVNPIDIVCLEVLRLSERELYREMSGAKSLLTGDDPLYEFRGENANTRKKDAVDRLLILASDGHRGTVEAILCGLFPIIQGMMRSFPGSSGDQDQWDRDARICSPNFFNRYFQLSIPEDDVSRHEIERIVSMAGDRDILVNEFASLRERNLLDVTVDRLESYKQNISLEQAVPFVTALFDIGDWLSERQPGLFEIDPLMHASRIVNWFLRQEPDPDKRGAVLVEATIQTTGLRLPIQVTSIDESGRKEQATDEHLMNDTGLRKMKELCVEKLRAAARDGTLSNQKDLIYLLYRWKNWAGDRMPRDWVASLISTPDGVMRFLKSVNAPYSVNGKTRWKVRLKYVEDFCDVDLLASAVDAGFGRELSEEENRAVEEYWKAVERRKKGKSDDGIFHDDED